jgi:flagellar basal body-associated protein FliL
MPAIRNNILMLLSHKTAAQVADARGQAQADAQSILYASVTAAGL